jgi:hypothetical protein
MRRTTTSRDVIRRWAEERGGSPARVKRSEVLRLAFERMPPNWEPISWDEFFRTFERDGLALWYEESPGSRLCKLTHAGGRRA